jgi:hypothetical protein
LEKTAQLAKAYGSYSNATYRLTSVSREEGKSEGKELDDEQTGLALRPVFSSWDVLSLFG